MAESAILHIQEFANTPEYRKRRDAYILTGEAQKDKIKGANEDEVNSPAMSFLFMTFPEFKTDYSSLSKHGFIEKTENGVRRGSNVAKQFITDYFKSVSSKKKKIPWANIESVFEEKQLKSRGASYNKPCKDFERWVKIKNSPPGE
jgi:hypothetical protein